MANKGAEVVKKSGGKPRYGICFAPSQYTDVGGAKLFGWWAEALIMLNYLKKTGAVPFVTDWFDVQARVPGIADATPIDNPIAFFNFLKRHHPQLLAQANDWNMEFQAGTTAVPDILTAKPNRHDYYEVKPGSSSGVRAGVDKLGKLLTLFKKPKYGLLAYSAGTTYDPGKADDIDITSAVPPILNIWARRLGLTRIKVTLSFRRSRDNPGLVLYWLCLDLEAEDELDTEAVENVARWYTVHSVRSLKANAMPTAVQAAPRLDIEFAHPAVRRLLPAQEELIRAAILSAGPATDYAIVGGSLAVDFVNEVAQVELEMARQRMEQIKKLLKVGVPGIPQLYANPSAINRGDFDYQSQAVFITTVTVVACVVVVVAVAVIIIASGGIAAAPLAAGAGLEGTAVGATVGGGAIVTGEVIAGSTVTSTAGAQVISLAARQVAIAAARTAAAKQLAKAAGVLLVLALSRDAVAGSRSQAAAMPSVTDVQGVQLVPARDIPGFDKVGPLGAIMLPGGKQGFRLGRIRLADAEGVLLGLDPRQPPD